MTAMHRFTRFAAAAVIIAATVSCGDVVRTGRGSSFLVIDSLLGIRGAVTVSTGSSPLSSDVITNVTSPAPCTIAAPCPTIFGDLGLASMRIVMKDAGSANPTLPTPFNDITLTRYRVEYTRADGRNTPGVDIPHAFDGAITTLISGSATSVGFSLVRLQAKDEPPLVLLRNGNTFFTALATVTFYGTDGAGSEVSAAGLIEITFGNFGDQ